MKRSVLTEKLIPILHEDASFLAVSKPAGIDVGAAETEAPTNLAAILRDMRNETATLRPVNRLSRYESGVLIFSKSEDVLRQLRVSFKSGKVSQEFVVVVRGRPARGGVVIEPTHGTSRGRRQDPHSRDRRAPAKENKRGDGTSGFVEVAKTFVSPLRSGDKLSIVRCRTRIATTHALRAQLRAVKLSALGDQPTGRDAHAHEGRESTHLHLSEIKILHPGTRSILTLRSKTPPYFRNTIEGRTDFTRHLASALIRRLALVESGVTNAYRLLAGDFEDVRGLVVERYADVVILHITHEGQRLLRQLDDIARWYQKTLGVRTVYVKHSPRDRSGAAVAEPGEHLIEQPLAGEPVAPRTCIIERGLTYIVRPYEGSAVGFYPDQRENRTRLRALSLDKDVLNLFAYTCSLSVAAASGKARSTTNVDLSQKSLEWGRENFGANYLGGDAHTFVASDVTSYLKRAGKENQRFDVAIVDPPSFAHGRKRGQSFYIVRDLPDLLRDVIGLLRPNGVLLLTTNHRRTKLSGLREFLTKGAGRRRFRVLDTPPLPDDFAVDADHAKSIIAQFE